jgi:hypothetical protein
MPHRFTHADEERLEGVWLTYKGRRFCAWRFEPGTGLMQTSRGVAVQTATLEAETRTLDELKEMLPKLALEMVLPEGREDDPRPH